MKAIYSSIKKWYLWSKTIVFIVLLNFASRDSVAQITLTPMDSFEIDTNRFGQF
jgi:hypothetical protein